MTFIVPTVSADKWHAHHNIGWSPTAASFGNRHRRDTQHSLYARQRPTSAFVGLALASPKTLLPTASRHHFVGNKY